jgi:hypothetical protein
LSQDRVDFVIRSAYTLKSVASAGAREKMVASGEKKSGHSKGIKAILAVLFCIWAGTKLWNAHQSDNNSNSQMAEATPPDERLFLKISNDYSAKFLDETRSLAMVPLRAERAKALCAAFPSGAVRNWVGRIDDISSTTNGLAIVKLYLGTGGFVENWNTETNAIEDRLPIPIDSVMHQRLLEMKNADLVRFDGTIMLHRHDCLRDMTSDKADSGDSIYDVMSHPRLIIQFSDIRPL